MTLLEYIGPIPYWTIVAMLLTTAVPMFLVNVSTTYQEIFAQVQELKRVVKARNDH
jgi:hypothetical protein